MKRNDLMLAAFAGFLVSTPARAQQDEQYVAAHGATVPETYIAADERESLHLDLWPDQGFHLLRTSGGSEPEGPVRRNRTGLSLGRRSFRPRRADATRQGRRHGFA